MSTNLIADLEQFTKEMVKYSRNQVIAVVPYAPNEEIRELRRRLIIEEVQETIDAIEKNDIVELADGIADSIVVLIGTALAYGIPLQKVWDEVHRSNMDKVTQPCTDHHRDGVIPCLLCNDTLRIPITPKIREDGKILKPDGWQPPNIKTIIEEAMK